jgi:hypothetical protein
MNIYHGDTEDTKDTEKEISWRRFAADERRSSGARVSMRS